jgi:hypothetical protein
MVSEHITKKEIINVHVETNGLDFFAVIVFFTLLLGVPEYHHKFDSKPN